jgi:glycosyltransferase involved in cell wall biosynthesis
VSQVPRIRLVLFGDGAGRPALEAQVRELGLQEHVVFAGFRNDAQVCMRAMDVVVHPSLSEAFCQVIVEALGAGTAVVATDVAGAPEVITSGEDGVLVPPGDPDALARAVLMLYRDLALRQRLANAGYRTVRERFTVERMVDRHAECYRRWLGVPGADNKQAEEALTAVSART